MTRTFALSLAVLSLVSCRYHAANVEKLAAECETHCAAMHQRCVQQGQAVKWGLPGVTFDLCRREQEACQRECRPLTPAVAVSDVSTPGPEGVIWEPETRHLSCARSPWRVTLNDTEAQALRRESGDAVIIQMPERVAQVRAGPKTSLLEDWAALHTQLTGQNDAKLNAQLTAESVGGATVWLGEYDVEGAGRFHFEAREQGPCRWLALERTSAPNR